jgi:hypothetical protein
LGSWLGTVKRERREADRKLVAGCYVAAAATSIQMPTSIRRRPLQWVIVALVEALNGIAIEALVTDLYPRAQCAHRRKLLDGKPDPNSGRLVPIRRGLPSFFSHPPRFVLAGNLLRRLVRS